MGKYIDQLDTGVRLQYIGHCSLFGEDSIVVQTHWISAYRYSVLVDAERITGQITGYSGQTCLTVNYVYRTVVKSD